jgi:3-keto-5-aminohexanoate cleavage enzyme
MAKKQVSAAKDKIVIVAAVNGGYQQSTDITKVPLTPLEIAQEAARCRKAGAAVVHFHARDAEGLTTGDVEVFRETIKLIREQSDILIQTTNGIGARKDKVTGEWIRPTDEDRLALLNLDPRPDLFGAATGSTDFIHPYGGQPNERPFINNRDWLAQAIRHAHSAGSAIEFEVVHTPALYRLRRMADEGVFDADADYLWLTHGGGIANLPGTPRVMLQSIDEGRLLFPNAKIGVMGAGPHQFPLSAVGMAAECDIMRIGLEDNVWRANGAPAQSNHQLVAEAVELAAYFRRRPADPAEAREIFGLNRTTKAH